METKMRYVALIFLLTLCSIASEKIEVLYEWKVIEYDFPNDTAKQAAIDNKKYVPGNTIPFDIAFWKKDDTEKLFLTIPNTKGDIPASLVTVTDKDGEKGGKLVKPYPDYSWHTNVEKCEGFASAFGTRVDECDRLWIIDSGKGNLLKENDNQICPERIFTFDLLTDKLVSKEELPKKVIKPLSVVTSLIVDVRDPEGKCEDTFVYIADVRAHGMIVYDVKNKKWWRIEDESMAPNPNYVKLTVNGVEVPLKDGLGGMVVAPKKNNERLVYYHAVMSYVETWVPTSVLRNEFNFKNGTILDESQFKHSEKARESATTNEAFSSKGILFFSPLTENSITCWNSEQQYTKENLHELYKDDERLQWVNTKSIENVNDDEFLYLLSNRFHLVVTDMLKLDEVNFRVIRGNVAELIEGTDCEVTEDKNQKRSLDDVEEDINKEINAFEDKTNDDIFSSFLSNILNFVNVDFSFP